jgi:nucleoside-triphosphatase THEP1
MEMLCDKSLSPKLDRYDLTRFINCHSTNLLIGAPGSGKTTLLISFFDKILRSCYHNIYLFQPSHSRASMKRDIFETVPECQKFDELNYENLRGVLDRIKSGEVDEDELEDDEEIDENEPINNCIIFDDMGAYLKDKSIRKLLKEIIYNRRHYHISVFFLCQSYLSCEKDIRKLFSNIFIFRVSPGELKTIFDEVVESKKELMFELSKMVWSTEYYDKNAIVCPDDLKHQYMFINTESQRIFKGFDEIISHHSVNERKTKSRCSSSPETIEKEKEAKQK